MRAMLRQRRGGTFAAGRWLLGVFIWYFVSFVISYGAVQGQVAVSGSSDIRISDPGFLGGNPGQAAQDINGTTDSQGKYDIDDIRAVFSFMTGIGTQHYDFGIPAGFQFIISILLFWLPTAMLVWALYMALPFLHGG